MDSLKHFFLGILTGIFISIVSAFFLNPTPTLTLEQQFKYIDLPFILPNYEFSTDALNYVEHLDTTYKIKTPFYLLPFNLNSFLEFTKPNGYVISRENIDNTDCISYGEKSNKVILFIKASQFKIPVCSLGIEYSKNLKNLN